MGQLATFLYLNGLACASAACLTTSAVLLFIADKIRQPSRGTRLPLGQIQQNIQSEIKPTSFKPSQRPVSVPNLKSLFNGHAKPVNDENRDIEKTAQSIYQPTTFVPPVRKSLVKRNTTIFRDPILTIVEEVDDASVTPNTEIEQNHAELHENTTPQLEILTNTNASFDVPESIIESTKDITLVQQDVQKDDSVHTTATVPQITDLQFISTSSTNLPALSISSEPDTKAIADAAYAAERYLNPPAQLNTCEPDIQDASATTILDTQAPPLALTTISESVVQKISPSPEFKESLVVDKVRGPKNRESNDALSTFVEAQVTTASSDNAITHAAVVTQTSVSQTRPSTNLDMNIDAFVPQIHTDHEEKNISHAMAKEDLQPAEPSLIASHLTNERKSSLDDGPPPRGSDEPKGLRAMVAKGIRPDWLPYEPVLAPKETQRVTVKKARDATMRAADYPAPLPWAPALQPAHIHQHVDNVAIPGMVGPKAVQSRYLTPHYTMTTDLREEEAYDSYEDDDYVTARSYNGESTNDGITTDLYPRWTQKARREVAEAAKIVGATRTIEDMEDEAMDPTMVAEYGEEIFEHLHYLEMKMLPNPFYMEAQNELQWSMRAVLMDWLVQVHSRCNLLPETLFITGNYVDRFLSGKVVSLGKLQLVGATALFLAAKKEEINCPTLSEIVYMVDNTYSSEELIKAERYMLNILRWELEWPGPLSFLRRISKADDYDLDTRTVAKYFLEVALMEERFIGTPPSFAAAASHCLARLVLRKGPWTPHHVHYSGYTYAQIFPVLEMLLYCVESPLRHHAAVYEKYADKRYKRASTYVEVAIQQGFVLPSPQGSSHRYVLNDLGVPYAPITPFQDFGHGGTTNASSAGMIFAN